MTINDWRDQFARSILQYAVLLILDQAPAHGYQIISHIHEMGLGEHKGGTIYPLLNRLSNKGLISHEWDTKGSGAARKVYILTELGQEELEDARDAWNEICLALPSEGPQVDNV